MVIFSTEIFILDWNLFFKNTAELQRLGWK